MASSWEFAALFVAGLGALAAFAGTLVLSVAAWRSAARARSEVAALREELELLRAPRAPLPPIPHRPAPPLPAVAPVRAVAPVAPEPSIPPVLPVPAVPPVTAVPPVPPIPPLPPPPEPTGRPTPPAATRLDWEGLVGVRLFSWVAGIALFVAAVSFLRYSIDHGWLSPPVRLGIGVGTGILLLAICEAKAARRYRVTANAMDGAAIAILYASLFAANSSWGLVGPTAAFGLMATVTALAVFLSIRRDSLFIALLGLLGGFATPALLSSGEDRPLTLFGYLLVVNAGLGVLAFRRRWPAVLLLSVALTAGYQWAWVLRFLDGERLPLAAGIFAAFPLLATALLAAAARSRGVETGAGARREDALLAGAASLSAGLPLLFAVWLAASPLLAGHHLLLFGFLFLLDAGLVALTAWRGEGVLALAAGSATAIVVASVVVRGSAASVAWPAVVFEVALVVLPFLALPLAAVWRSHAPSSPPPRPLDAPAEAAVFAAPLLLLAFPWLAATDERAASALPLFGALYPLAGATAFVAGFSPGGRLRALFPALLPSLLFTTAAWQVHHGSAAEGGWLPGLALSVACGAFFAAAPLVADAAGRPLAGPGSPVRLLALSGHLLLLAAAPGIRLDGGEDPALLLLAGGAACLVAFGAAWLPPAPAVQAGSLLLGGILPAIVAASSGGGRDLLLACGSAALLALFGIACERAASGKGGEGTHGEAGWAEGAAAALLLGTLTAATAGARGAPPLAACATGLFLAAGALFLSRASTPRLAPVFAALSFAVPALLGRPAGWDARLLGALAPWLLFVGAAALRPRERADDEPGAAPLAPVLAASIASAAFFLVARDALLEGGLGGAIGLLPLVESAVLSLLVLRLLRMRAPAGSGPAGGEAGSPPVDAGVALAAASALAFLTVAIPLQLKREWWTIGWALLALALVRLHARIPHRGLLAWSAGLFAAVFVRLALNAEVLRYHPAGTAPVLNWTLYTYGVPVLSLFLAARLLRGSPGTLPGDLPRPAPLFAALGTVLLFVLVNLEVAGAFAGGSWIRLRLLGGSLAEDLAYTLSWAVFAVLLLAAGVIQRSRPARVSAIALLALTSLKAFLLDLSRLGGLYRVASFVGLALSLALVALALQRFVLGQPPDDGR